METQDWKSNIGNYLVTRNIYRIGYLNKQLEAICKEWASYLQQFDGIEADSSVGSLPYELNHDLEGKYIFVCVKVRSRFKEYFPFKASLYFENNLKLVIQYSAGYSVKKMIEYKIDCDDVYRRLIENFIPDFYDWKTEIFEGSEIHESRYLFQILNNRMMEWMNMQLSED